MSETNETISKETVGDTADLAHFDHGVDCDSIEWGWDGIEGESGLPCNCWRAALGLPQKVAYQS